MRRKQPLVAVAALGLAVVIIFSKSLSKTRGFPSFAETAVSSQQRHHLSSSREGSNCSLAKVTYTPCLLERQWLKNAESWGTHNFCEHAVQFEKESAEWLAGVAAHAETFESIGDLNPAVFSKFVHEYECDGSDGDARTKRRTTFTSWIEPLSHGLRHPSALCGSNNNKDDVLNRDYILLATRGDTDHERGSQCYGRACQNIMVDLGASTWRLGAGGPSQSWFELKYRRRGIEFDRFLMWEARPAPATEVFKDLPPHLWHRYQYFNVPASADAADPSSPLNIIKQIAQPGDFVVFKLDIDNFKVEGKIVEEMLKDDDGVLALIDEFLYEEHVRFPPMLRYWEGSAHPTRTLHDSYQLFFELRKRGVRAHSWV